MRTPPSLKISLSGVRGIAGKSLTPQIVSSFAAAFGTYCASHKITDKVILGTDTRPSRLMVTLAAEAGLQSVGCKSVNIGIVPAPTLQFFIREYGASGGICVTASHNPQEWNALKFFGSDGIVLRPNQFAELTDLYHQGVYPRVDNDRIPATEEAVATPSHQRAVEKLVDTELIRSRKLTVVADCCNGAASRAAPEFLGGLGCQVIPLNADPGLPFPRNPEPRAENLSALCRSVLEAKADIGFALDADADRLAIVDEKGSPLGEDCTIALATRHILIHDPGPVVVNVSTSRMLDDIAREYGCPIYKTRVGEIHVIERMLECGARIGGEGTGGVIVPDTNPCRDSFVGMALVLEALAEEQCRISQLRDKLPHYHIAKEKVACRTRDIAPFLRLMRHLYRDEQLDVIDGVKVLWPDKWLHLRGSNTEPIIRVIAEAKTKGEASSLVADALEYMRPLIGSGE